MNDHDELVRRATVLLEVDRELYLDVGQELRAHLEDSAEEFRQAGYGEEDASSSAAKALGDPDELAETLWRANRFRMRIRGILRWTARATLMPAAILIVIALAVGVAAVVWPDTPKSVPASWLADLTEDERFIFLGDDNGGGKLERAKSIADRWPDNPIYYSHYVIEVLNQVDRQKIQKDPSYVAELLGVLGKGERIDPENALYNFLKASLLLEASSRLTMDEMRPYRPYERTKNGQLSPKYCWKIEIHDLTTFQRALSEFYSGLPKSSFTRYWHKMEELRLALLDHPKRLSTAFHQLIVPGETSVPQDLMWLKLGRSLWAYAVQRGEAGDPAAVNLTQSVMLMGAKSGISSDFLVELIVGDILINDALAHQEYVHNALGQPALAESAYVQRMERSKFAGGLNRDVLGMAPEQIKHAGLFWSVSGSHWVDFGRTTEHLEPMRTAEYTVALQLGLLVLLGVLATLALVCAVATVESLFARQSNKGILLFVGWRRIMRICLLAIVLPLTTYGLYAHVQVANENAYGVNYTIDRIVLEWASVMSVVCVLLIALSHRAIRRRVVQLGLAVPEHVPLRKRKLLVWLGAPVILAAGVYLVGWWAGYFRPAVENWSRSSASRNWFVPDMRHCSYTGLVLAAIMVGLMLAWGFREAIAGLRGDTRYLGYRRTLYRSLSPILASAVIVVGIACGSLLLRAETLAVSRITGKSALRINEIDNSPYRLLKQRLQKEHAGMMHDRPDSAGQVGTWIGMNAVDMSGVTSQIVE